MARIVTVAAFAGAALMLAACGSTTTSDPAPPSVPGPSSEASSTAPADGVSCADIGGVFEAHGTDGRGSCVSADRRAQCHLRPGEQPGNYVAEILLEPPFPDGRITRGELAVNRLMLESASNAECWHLPPA